MHTSTIQPQSFASARKGSRNPGRAILRTALALLAGLSARTLAAQVPAAVASTQTTIASGFSAGPAVTDSCGDVYVYESGGTGVVEIHAGTGVVSTVIANAQGYGSSGMALYMDAAKKNLYFPDFGNFYTTHFDQLPIVNCVPGTVNAAFASNLYDLPTPNYYWGTAQDVAGDAAGNVFFITTSNVQSAIYEEIFNSSANTYAPAQILQSWPNNLTHIVADAAGDVFFNDGTANLYELKAPYTTAPTVAAPFATGFNSVVGLSIDLQGNLYVADGGASVVYEIPNESGTLNPAHQYALASVGLVYKVGIDAFHNLYLSNYYPGAVKVQIGSGTAPATAVGSTSGSIGIDYIFNAAVTPTSITAVTGASPSTTFSTGTGGCAVGTAYKALGTCSVNATYTPSAVGEQTGAILFTSSAGTVITNVSGIGQGAAVTIDPGLVVPTATTLKAPSGVTVDNLGNVYVTDSTANTLTEFPAGSNGVGTTVSTGSVALNAPSSVAVDNVGDIFIANTGANQVVEIPVVNGVLTNASTAALPLTLKNPEGVATDGVGNLYIADTGDNNLLFVPNLSGTLGFSDTQSFGTSLDSPSAVTVDPNGKVYLAEASDVLAFAAPLGSAAQVKVISGLSSPTALATDASGSLFVVDSGTASILRYPSIGGNFGPKTLVGSTIVNPVGVATDASGNLYVTDTTDSVTATIDRVDAALNFGGWNVGSSSTPFTAAVNSSGNEQAVFQSPDYTTSGNTAAGYSVTSDSCTGASLLPGGACAVTATFTPPAPELNAQENLNFLSNAGNGAPQLQLIGTGAHITPSTISLVLAGPTPLNAGQSVTLTATIGTGSNTAPPGGSIKFLVNGTAVGTVAVTNGAASLTLKNGLPAGSAVVLTATYSGDVINYSGSTVSIDEVVIGLSDSLTLAISGLSTTTLYNNPFSANDDTYATYTLSTIARSGGTVTATLGTPVTLSAGAVVSVAGVSDTSYDGVFVLASANGSTLVWQQAGADSSSTKGTLAARQQSSTGPSLQLTATLAPSSTIAPNGVVAFMAGTTTIGVASVLPTASGYQAILPTTALRAGTSANASGSFLANYNLSAVYSNDTTYNPATSNVVPISIVAPPAAAPACALTGTTGATCQLNTTGAFYTITPANPTITATTTTAGGPASGSTTLTLNSYGGYNGILNFTCSGLPAYAQCAPYPGDPTVVPSTLAANVVPATVDLIINTNVAPIVPTGSSMVWWLSGATGFLLLSLRRRIQRMGYLRGGQLFTVAGGLLLFVGSVLGLGGCGSSGYSFITPAGSSTVTVKVSSAQLDPASGTTGATYLPDPNPLTFQVTLVVK